MASKDPYFASFFTSSHGIMHPFATGSPKESKRR